MHKHLASALLVLLLAAPGEAAGYTNSELKKMFQRSVDTEDTDERARLRVEIAQAAPDSAYGLASRAYLMQGRLTPFAIASIYTKALELDPTIAVVYYNRSNIYLETGQYEKALEGYEKAVSLGLKDGSVYQGIGDCHMQLGRDEEAIKFLSKAIELDPTLHFAYNNRGGVYMRTGQYDKAIADLNAALKLADFAMAYMNRADAWAGKKEFEKALADFKTAEEMTGGAPDLRARRAKVYLQMGENAKAKAEAGAVLAAQPGNLLALDVLGKAAFALGDYAGAEDAYKRRAARDPLHPYAYEQLYRLYAVTKRPDLAADALRKALEIAPGRADLQEKLTGLQLRAGALAGSEADFTAMIGTGTADAKLYYFRGRSRIESKNYKGAEEDFKQVLRLVPDSPDAMTSLSLVFLRTARRDEGLELFSSALDNDPPTRELLNDSLREKGGRGAPGKNFRSALREMLALYDKKNPAAPAAQKGTAAKAPAAEEKKAGGPLTQEDCYCIYYTGRVPPYFIARVDPVKPGCEKIQFAPDPAKPGVDGLKNCKEFQSAE